MLTLNALWDSTEALVLNIQHAHLALCMPSYQETPTSAALETLAQIQDYIVCYKLWCFTVRTKISVHIETKQFIYGK